MRGGGSPQGGPLLIALDQHGPRFISRFNSKKGPAELRPTELSKV